MAIVTNYVTAQPPKWAENTVLVWSVFAGLAIVSLGLFFWERHLATGAPDGGVRPVPLGRIAAGGHSMNPPTVPAPVRGREAELERIGSLVRGPGGGMAVVCGAGGLGKTTLAAEAAAQARDQGQVVVWVRWRDDPDQLGQDLAQAAHILGLPEARLEEARTGRVSLVDAVWEHLATVTGWLIVVDNVDTPSRVGPGSGLPAAYRGWLRPHGSGVLLVTSRDTTRQTWGPDADMLHLQPLADDAGAAVLLDAAPHAGTEAEAEALAARLGGLPLALNAAGTYLSVPTSRHRTFTAYQHALEAEFADLLGAEHPAAATDPAVARRVVRHTWDLSLDQLHSDGYSLARPVLQLLALLEPAPVPRTLMTPELVTDATGLPATAATVDAAVAGSTSTDSSTHPKPTDPRPSHRPWGSSSSTPWSGKSPRTPWIAPSLRARGSRRSTSTWPGPSRWSRACPAGPAGQPHASSPPTSQPTSTATHPTTSPPHATPWTRSPTSSTPQEQRPENCSCADTSWTTNPPSWASTTPTPSAAATTSPAP
ncbi:hypothetical protein [Streptomyces rubiginosohelvolus]|uniref:hypothetical protein n=1 Tax=Streptomyces rubiginosohelvolus TaxID=67362 RepID=UPI00339E76A6